MFPFHLFTIWNQTISFILYREKCHWYSFPFISHFKGFESRVLSFVMKRNFTLSCYVRNGTEFSQANCFSAIIWIHWNTTAWSNHCIRFHLRFVSLKRDEELTSWKASHNFKVYHDNGLWNAILLLYILYSSFISRYLHYSFLFTPHIHSFIVKKAKNMLMKISRKYSSYFLKWTCPWFSDLISHKKVFKNLNFLNSWNRISRSLV